jgi:competence protein ComEA
LFHYLIYKKGMNRMELWLRRHWQKAVLVILLLGGGAYVGLRHLPAGKVEPQWLSVNEEMSALLSPAPQNPKGPEQTQADAAVKEEPPASEATAAAAAANSQVSPQPTAKSADAAVKNGKTSSGAIDINSATATRLTDLPGIGPSKAKAIVAYREANGPFSAPEDLMKVKGIGAKTFEALKSRVAVLP